MFNRSVISMAIVLPRFSSNGLTCEYTTNYHFCVDTDSESFHNYLGDNIDILQINFTEGPRIRVYASVTIDCNAGVVFDNLHLLLLQGKSISKQQRVVILRLLNHAKYPTWLKCFIAEELKKWK